MAGQRSGLISFSVALAIVCSAHGEPGAAQQGLPRFKKEREKEREKEMREGQPGFEEFNSPGFENARRAIEALSPEQRKQLQDNMQHWASLPPEVRNILRMREEVRREQRAEEGERALKASGLVLEPVRREAFLKRYAEERRLLEEELRKEMQEKRRPAIQALIARLRQEFSGGALPAATPAPPVPATGTP